MLHSIPTMTEVELINRRKAILADENYINLMRQQRDPLNERQLARYKLQLDAIDAQLRELNIEAAVPPRRAGTNLSANKVMVPARVASPKATKPAEPVAKPVPRRTGGAVAVVKKNVEHKITVRAGDDAESVGSKPPTKVMGNTSKKTSSDIAADAANSRANAAAAAAAVKPVPRRPATAVQAKPMTKRATPAAAAASAAVARAAEAEDSDDDLSDGDTNVGADEEIYLD